MDLLKKVVATIGGKTFGSRPQPRFGTEQLPIRHVIEVTEEFDEWSHEYDQFFGTQVCLQAAKKDSNFAKFEYYKMWARYMVPKFGKDAASSFHIDRVMSAMMKGVPPEQRFAMAVSRQDRKFYSELSKNLSAKNKHVWNYVLMHTNFQDEKPLTESNVRERYDTYKQTYGKGSKKKAPAPQKRAAKKIRFEAPEPTRAKLNYFDMMRKLKTTRRGISRGAQNQQKANQMEMLNKYFRPSDNPNEGMFPKGGFHTQLSKVLDKVRESSDDDTVRQQWKQLMDDYVNMVSLIARRQPNMSKWIPNRKDLKRDVRVGEHMLEGLKEMHRQLIDIMRTRRVLSPEDTLKYKNVYPVKPTEMKQDPRVDIKKETSPPSTPTKPRKRPRPKGSPAIARIKNFLKSFIGKGSPPSTPPRTPPPTPKREPGDSPAIQRLKGIKRDITEIQKGKIPSLDFVSTPIRENVRKKLWSVGEMERLDLMRKLKAIPKDKQAAFFAEQTIRVEDTAARIKKLLAKRGGVRVDRPGLPKPAGDSVELKMPELERVPKKPMRMEDSAERHGRAVKHEPEDDWERQLLNFERMRDVRMRRFDDEDTFSFGHARTMRTGITFRTDRAVIDIPIAGETIVRLRDIKRRMGEKVDLFQDNDILGFDRKHWETQLYQKFPIDMADGVKQQMGSWIKTSLNRKKREFQFTVYKKSTPMQRNSLIAVIESKCPPFHYLTVHIRRKVWELVYNVHSLFGLQSYFTSELENVSKVHMKLTW